MCEARECVRVYAEIRESKNTRQEVRDASREMLYVRCQGIDFNYALLGSQWVLLWFGGMAPKRCHAEPKHYRVRYVRIYGTWWTVDGCFQMAGAIGRSSAGKLAHIYIVKRGKLRAHCAMRRKAAPHVGIAVGSIQSDATSSCCILLGENCNIAQGEAQYLLGELKLQYLYTEACQCKGNHMANAQRSLEFKGELHDQVLGLHSEKKRVINKDKKAHKNIAIRAKVKAEEVEAKAEGAETLPWFWKRVRRWFEGIGAAERVARRG
ncbi:uncharacterized protein F5147DRAFT_656861 [Suillus discolor]|uniref:Uncharacterized protein n=1 Tax=Suillus discolor TaxID=1912936 RepID=A0A9P7JPN2_9AGAM|nr:uncharacterized protein F5147DRAFT_656861 [Suillus discolor]KAG2095438.1 hypothetical protein F5147DRAFT_656861 [Suillus discolor]